MSLLHSFLTFITNCGGWFFAKYFYFGCFFTAFSVILLTIKLFKMFIGGYKKDD